MSSPFASALIPPFFASPSTKPKRSRIIPCPPDSKLGAFFWRTHLWLECTFAFTVMEPWEQLLILSIWSILMIVVCTGIYCYLPKYLVNLQVRWMYYLLGRKAHSSHWGHMINSHNDSDVLKR